MRGRFTEAESALVVDAFRRGGLVAAVAALPDRTSTGIAGHLQSLGLHKPKGRRCWRTDEIAALRAGWLAGETARAIGLRLGRSTLAVRVRIEKLKLPKKLHRWTPGQTRIVEREVDAMIDRLCERLGRSQGAVENRLAHAFMTRKRRKNAAKIGDLGAAPWQQKPSKRAA